MKKYLTPAALLLCVLILLVLLLRFFTTSTLTIRITPQVSPLATTVTLDGRLLAPSGDNGTLYTAKAGYGTHKIRVISAGFKEVDIHNIDTRFRSAKEQSVRLEPLSADAAANLAVQEIEGIQVFNPRYFGNNQWVVFSVKSSTGVSEGSIIIARHSPVKNDWEIIEEGTDINIYADIYADAPTELTSYVETLYQ